MAKRFVIQKLSKICEPGEIYPREYPAGEYTVSDEPGEDHITNHAADVAKREGWGGPLDRKSKSGKNPELNLTGKGGSDVDDKDKKDASETDKDTADNQTDPDKKAETDGQTGEGSDAQSSQQDQASAKPGSNDSKGKAASSSSTKAGG